MKNLHLPKENTFTGPASIWKRGLAFVVDLLVINLIILFPFRRLFQKIIPDSASFSETFNSISQNSEFGQAITFLSVIIALMSILYFYILEKKLHQSVGKILFNIKVISDYKELKGWQLIVRSLFLIPIFPFVILWIVDPIVLIFTKTDQRLSEILSKTKVVEVYHL